MNHYVEDGERIDDVERRVGPSDGVVEIAKKLRATWLSKSGQLPHLAREGANHPEREFIRALQVRSQITRLGLRGVISHTAYEELVRAMGWTTGTSVDHEREVKSSRLDALSLYEFLDFEPDVAGEERLANLFPLCEPRRGVSTSVVQESDGAAHTFPAYLSWLATTPYYDSTSGNSIIGDRFMGLPSDQPVPLFAKLARHSALSVLQSAALRMTGVEWDEPTVGFEADVYGGPVWSPSDLSWTDANRLDRSLWGLLNTTMAAHGFDLQPPHNDMTLLDFLELVRADAIGTSSNPDLQAGGEPILSYRALREYIRFWRTIWLFDEGQRAELQRLDWGRAIDTLGTDFDKPIDLPYGFDHQNFTIDEVERRVLSSLSCATDRVDSWVTAIAKQRLEQIDRPGTQVGGFGYVENLRVSDDPVSAGYIHAPSLAQAQTAAVLKSGHLTQISESGVANNTLSIDLSSSRVRAALELLEGVREGQTFGVLLGVRFERALRDRATASRNFYPIIRALRAKYPRRVTREMFRADGTDAETPALSSVVDGLKLIRDSRARNVIAQIDSVLVDVVWDVVQDLRKDVKAIEDLLLSESVHQLMQGNTTRTASSLHTSSRAAPPADRYDVVRTPRTGIAVVNKVVMLVDPNRVSGSSSARAKAEPKLNAVAESLLGLHDASTVTCEVTYQTSTGGTTNRTVTLSDLLNEPFFNLEAVDLFYLPEIDSASTATTLNAYVRHHVMNRAGSGGWPAIDYDAEIAINAEATSAGRISFRDFFDLCSVWREVLLSGRELNQTDLMLPTDFVDDGLVVDGAAIVARDTLAEILIAIRNVLAVTDPANALSGLEQAIGVQPNELSELNSLVLLPATADLDAVLEVVGVSDAQIETLRELLFRLLEFGVSSAVVKTFHRSQENDKVDIVATAIAAYREATQRLNAAASAIEPSGSMEALFGRSMSLRAISGADASYNFGELFSSFANSAALQSGDPNSVWSWLSQVGHGRDRIGTFCEATELTSILRPSSDASSSVGSGVMSVGQLPYSEGDLWAATHKTTQSNTTSYAIFDPMGVLTQLDPGDVTAPDLVGVVIDEWTDVIPNATETTGVAFHYDRPAAEPPQTVLVAVPPERSPAQWSLEALASTVLETVDLAKVRGVDPVLFGNLSPFLPALYFADFEKPDPWMNDVDPAPSMTVTDILQR